MTTKFNIDTPPYGLHFMSGDYPTIADGIGTLPPRSFSGGYSIGTKIESNYRNINGNISGLQFVTYLVLNSDTVGYEKYMRRYNSSNNTWEAWSAITT